MLCTGNSARSQMAETMFRHLSRGAIEVVSAGSTPQPEIHPLARQAVRRLLGLEMDDQHPKSVDRFITQRFDYVITVCDRAAEACPVFPGAPERVHWSLEDPAATGGTPEERQRAFDRIAEKLHTRIRDWLSLTEVNGGMR